MYKIYYIFTYYIYEQPNFINFSNAYRFFQGLCRTYSGDGISCKIRFHILFVLVIGAGVNGLWTGISLLKRGFSVTIVDQFGLNNDRGSSHGQSRITRYLYDEPTYPAFMPESDRKWKQLQKDFKTNLYKRSEFEYACTR